MRHRKYITVLFLFFITIHLFAENTIDSLENIIKNHKKDTTYVNAVIKLVTIIRFSDMSRAENLIKESISISNNLKFTKGIALLKLIYGSIYHIKGDYPNAEKLYFESLELLKKINLKKETAKCYNNLGNLYQLKSEYEKALSFLLESRKIAESNNDNKGISQAELNIGNIYMQKKDFNFAIEHFNTSLKFNKGSTDLTTKSQAYNNLGATYRLMNKLDTALYFYNKSLSIRKEQNDNVGTAENLLNIGDVYFCKNNPDSAEIYFEQALILYRGLNHKIGIAYTLNNLGSILYEKKNYNKALDTLISASNISKEIGALDLQAETYKNIAEIYFEIGNYKKSAIYQKEFSILRDTILNEQNQKQIAEMQTKYDTEKKEKEILQLNQDKIIREADLQKKSKEVEIQKIIIFSFIVVLILIVVFSLLLYKQFRAKKIAYIKLEKQNFEINQKNEEISSQRDEIESQRDEIMAQRDLVMRQKEEIEIIHEKVTSSIRYAERIQHAMLPTEEMSKMLLADHFILYKPKDIVSGDFYWTMIKKEWLYIAVADCTGHGVPGAFMSMLGISLLNEIIAQNEKICANEILQTLREMIIHSLKQSSFSDSLNNSSGTSNNVKDGMDISLVVLNLENYHLQYSGANNPLYIIQNGIFSEIKGDKMPIAIYERMNDYQNHELNLQKGDIFYLTSDGYADQFGGPENKKFYKKQLKNIFSTIFMLEMVNQKEILEKQLSEWKGQKEQTDDITIVGIKLN